MAETFGSSGSAARSGVFRPSLVVNLQILFDQGLQEQYTPKSPRQQAETVSVPGLSFDLRSDVITATATPETEEITIEGLSFDLSGKEPKVVDTVPAAPTAQPESISEAGAEAFSKVMNLVPVGATIELPAFRQAGTFSLDLLHRDLPIDPRVIRAMRAEIHLGVVSSEDFAFGMVGRAGEGGRRSSVLVPTATNLVIVGMADSITSEFSDKGSTIHIEGRDLRGMLLDANIAPKILEKLDLKQPLDSVVRNLVQVFHPQGRGLQVSVQPSEWPNGVVPSPHVAGNLTRTKFDADPAQAGPAQSGSAAGKTVSAIQGNPNTISYWDMITQWCLVCGAIPYFVGPQLRIRPTKSLFDQRNVDQAPFDPNFPYPFGGNQPHKREVGQPLVSKPEAPFGYRRMVFGKDIQHLKFERKFGGMVVPSVRVVSYDGDNPAKGAANRLLDVTYPPDDGSADSRRTSRVGSSGKGATTDEIYLSYPGIKSRAALQTIAESLYTEIGRQELGGAVSTKNLSSFGGGNHDPDLLLLRPGDPVEIRTVDSGLQTYPPFTSELLDHTSKSFEAEVAAVAKRLGDKDLAFYIVASARGNLQQLTRTFRVANVKFDWSAESGVGIAFDFQNFIEVRYTFPNETAGTAEPEGEKLPTDPGEVSVEFGDIEIEGGE